MRRTPPILAVCLLLPALALAQKANPASTTIQVTSRIVYVDVIVRDASGHVVHGLTRQDFKVEEDGKSQTIDYFDEHIYNPVTRSPGPRPVSNREFSNVTSPGESGAVTILLLDLLNTPTTNQLVAREQMLKFLQILPPGRPISLFTLTDKLQMIQSFTGSPELLANAAKMLKPVNLHHMPSREEVQQDQDTAAEFNRESTIKGHTPSGSTAMDGNVQTQDSDLDLRTHSTIAALNQLAHIMSKYEGRKNLLWVSESFPVALNTTHNYLGQTLPVDARRMTDLLADARIAVYPVSVLGMDYGKSPLSFRKPPDPVMEYQIQFMERGNLKSAMNEIADQTGGQAIVGTNDLAGAMRGDLDDGSNYYTLAYQPQNKKWNKQFRNIRVELTQTGDTLAYRRGYFAYPDNAAPPDPAQELTAALQPEMPESTTLALRSTVDLPNAQHSGVLVHAVLSAANLDLVSSSDGHRRGQLMVRLIAFNDAPGKERPDPPPQTSAVLNLDFDPARYQAIVNNGIAFTPQMKLPPGRYRLRLGVSDVASHRLGTLDMPIAVPGQTAKN